MLNRSQALRKPVSEYDADGANDELLRSSSVSPSPKPGIGMYVGIFLTAASILLLELALTRVFAVLLWAHLAFMVVGTALFGFGLSGVYLALRPQKSSSGLEKSLSGLSILMGISAVACYLVINYVPFRMWHFSEDPSNYFFLAVWYLALVVPFFLGGLIVAKLLSTFDRHSTKLYGVDLIGAAAGSLLLIPVIPKVGAEGTVVVAALLAVAAGYFYAPQALRGRRITCLVAVAILAILAPKASSVLPIKLHENKRRFNVAQAYNHIYETNWSPISRVDVAYHSNDIFDIWIDGGTNESAILRWSGDMATLKPMTWSTIGASYDLKAGTEPNVMIIGPAGGKEVLFALSHGAKHVDAVEMDPSIVKMVNKPKYAKFMGGLYQHEKVSLHNDEGRSFLRRQPMEHYDVIQSVNNYTPVAMNAGALNLSAAFLMTKQAIGDYLDHLTPNGVLALHRGAAVRIAIAMREVLAERGVQNPENHIVIFSGEVPYFDGIFLKKSPWTAEEVNKLDAYLEGRPLQARKFLWNPVDPIKAGLFYEILTAPVDTLAKFYTSLGVNLTPPTDDQPFMEHFLLFGKQNLDPRLPEEFSFRDKQKWRGMIPRGDFPYLAILTESALLALLFVGLPLALFARKSISSPFFKGFLGYFSCLGFGFIVIEICLMKRYILFLGNPAYSITTVLVALLAGAGVGSIFATKLFNGNPKRSLKLVLPAVVLSVCAETVLSPIIFDSFLYQDFGMRIAIASMILLPLGFVMGMPFSLGLRLISDTTPDPIERQSISAWAWGMNGYFTVIGSASTVFIAVLFGFKMALSLAVLAYVIGLLAIRPALR